MKRLTKKILNRLNLFDEAIDLSSLQIPLKEIYRLKRDNKGQTDSVLFGKEIGITDPFWYVHGLHEIFKDEVYWFDPATESPLIIDCGANIGLSVIYFKRKYPKAKIIAFEPDNEIFAVMQNNLSQFDITGVESIQKAVWINDDPLLFRKNGSVGGHLSTIEGENTIKIETTRLKNYLRNKVDFLKIDIEGAEFDIIKDCETELINVENLFIEYHSFQENPQMLGELLIILKNAGFKYYIKEAWENMKNPFKEKQGPYFDLQLNIFGFRKA
jgi:FkbM family methyltransferase